MTKRTDEGTNATPPAAPARKRVKRIPSNLPAGSVLSITGVEICALGEDISEEELDRRFSLVDEKILGKLPQMYDELGITPPDHSSPEPDDDE